MKILLAVVFILSIAIPSIAATSVTQAVFSIATTAVTATSNLRVAPMDMRLAKDSNNNLMQTYVLTAGTTQNLFLTKSTTVSLAGALCLLIQADQDTLMKLNSESVFMKVYSGSDTIRCFK
jgi:hypothetical protein